MEIRADVFASAEIRVGGEIPEALRAAARARQTAALTELAELELEAQDAEDHLADAYLSHSGDDGQVRKREIEFLRKQTELRELAERLESDLERAASILTSVAAADPLSDAVSLRIETLTIEGSAALTAHPTLATALDQAQGNVQESEAAIAATEAEIEATPDDPDLQIRLAEQQAELDDVLIPAQEAASTALDECVASINRWEAAVPDEAWSRLRLFDEAERILDRVGATLPTDDSLAAEQAERDLANDLTSAATNRRTIVAAEAMLDAATAKLETYEAARTALLTAALSGDRDSDLPE